jgi:hypothetical protein
VKGATASCTVYEHQLSHSFITLKRCQVLGYCRVHQPACRSDTRMSWNPTRLKRVRCFVLDVVLNWVISRGLLIRGPYSVLVRAEIGRTARAPGRSNRTSSLASTMVGTTRPSTVHHRYIPISGVPAQAILTTLIRVIIFCSLSIFRPDINT